MRIGKFELSNEAFERIPSEDQKLLCEFLEPIEIQYFVGQNAAIWFETDKIQTMLDNLPASEITHKGQQIPLATLLRTIFDTQAGSMGIQHIIIDEHVESAENSIYNDLGIWIVSFNFYITALYMVFVNQQWDANPLTLFTQKYGFTLDTKQ